MSITGITPASSYPKGIYINYNKQCLSTDTVSMPIEKHGIEEIEEIKATIYVERYKVINTILGPKIILNGIKKIRIIYTANNNEKSIHSASWNINFSEFILLNGLQYDECISNIEYIFVGLEDISVGYCDERNLDIILSFIIYPKLRNDIYLNSKIYNLRMRSYY